MKVATAVQEVTVFTDRARLTRRGKLDLPASGLHRLEIADLPEGVDRDSVRVAARGPAGTRLFGVDVTYEHHAEVVVEKMQRLQETLQALKDEVAVVDEQMANMHHRLAALDKLIDSASIYAKGLARGQWTREQQAATFDDFYRDRERCQSTVRGLLPRKRQLDKDIDKVQRQIKDTSLERGWKKSTTVTVELETAQAGSVEVDVSYLLLEQASWKPLYDLRWRSGRLEFAYMASVQQCTGEDWKQVELSLSTAQPGTATSVPRLRPWDIGMAREPFDIVATMAPRLRASATAEGDFLASRDLAAASAAPMESAAEVHSTVSTTGLVTSYQVPGGADIPSDNAPHKVTLGRFELNPKVEFVAVPRLNPAAVRRLNATLEGGYTLLAGQAMLFDGDDFLGRTQIPPTTPGQQLKLFFGVDPRFRIERRQTKREVSRSFMGGKRRIQFGYEIQIDSGMDQAAELLVVDHLPRPRHEDIKVAVVSMEPKPIKQADDGIIIWRVTAPARGKLTLRWEFTIEHPKDANVTGLE